MIETVKILETRKDAHITTFTLDKSMKAEPGQFVMLWLPDVDEKPFGLSKIGKNIEITVDPVGPFTKELCKLKPGDFVGIRGPYGHGWKKWKGSAVVVAGGVGISPLMPLIEAGEVTTVIFAGRCKERLFFLDRLQKADCELILTTDDGSCGQKCYAHNALESLLEDKKHDEILCCGPEIMMKCVADVAKQHGIPCQLSLDRYMKCGCGVCGSCAIDPKGLCVCSDGPVFYAREIGHGEFGAYKRDTAGCRHDL